jgi:hypothetical protein
MSNQSRLTGNSGPHGVVSNKLHQIHQAQQKARLARKVKFIAVEIVEPGESYPPFRSDVTGVSAGRNFVLEKSVLKLLDGAEWLSRLRAAGREYSWHHQRQVRKGKVGYYKRNVKDREKLSPTDKNAREETDIRRFTIDLRPDHSRAVQKILAAGMKDPLDGVLTEIRGEMVRLFEEIYGRRVLFVGEHPDSGQYHNDLWHGGIEEVEIEDEGAVRGTGGEKRVVRRRTPYRAFGVGVGMDSFDRHRSALVDGGMGENDVKALMGLTLELINRNAAATQLQNKGEVPRDLRLNRALDEYVQRKLGELSPELAAEAGSEYLAWIEKGYRDGALGVQEKTTKVTEEVRELRKRVEELDKEVSSLWAIRDGVMKFLPKLLERLGLAALRELGEELWDMFCKLAELVEYEIPSLRIRDGEKEKKGSKKNTIVQPAAQEPS